MSVRELYKRALKLNPIERSVFANHLLDTVEPEGDGELSAEWKAEIDRRIKEIEAHPEGCCTWEEVKKSLKPKKRKRTAS